MSPQDAVDIGREAILNGLWLSLPILIVGLIIGVGIGILQSITQVQDQTVSFTPKIVLMVLALCLCLPWLTDRIVDYSKQQFGKLPDSIQIDRQAWNSETKWR